MKTGDGRPVFCYNKGRNSAIRRKRGGKYPREDSPAVFPGKQPVRKRARRKGRSTLIASALQAFQDASLRTERDVSLAERTSFRIGGKADLRVRPAHRENFVTGLTQQVRARAERRQPRFDPHRGFIINRIRDDPGDVPDGMAVHGVQRQMIDEALHSIEQRNSGLQHFRAEFPSVAGPRGDAEDLKSAASAVRRPFHRERLPLLF